MELAGSASSQEYTLWGSRKILSWSSGTEHERIKSVVRKGWQEKYPYNLREYQGAFESSYTRGK